MTRPAWPRVEEVYHAALEHPAAEREAFLDGACGGDEELRREVRSLLAHEREAERLMEEPALGAATQRLAVVPGTRLGPYEVTDLVGAGGMGEVYRARDTRLGRDVAIKVLPEHVAHDPDALARFGREARAVAALSHPHIAALFDIGETNGTHYLVMELLEGETLAGRLRRGALPEKDTLRIGTEIAEALGAAHAHGIVHRDVKPANVILTRSGVKLLDFGLARLQRKADASGETAAATTELGERGVAGTLPYMAPEQLEGREADARTDIWALGCVLFEMLTGRRAFEGDSQARLIAAIEKDDVPSLTIHRLAASPAVDPLVRQCLMKDPTERWQSAQDLALRLREIAGAGSEAEGGRPTREMKRLSVAAIAGRVGLLLAVLGAIAAAFAAGGHFERRPVPSYHQLTFRRGVVGRARFAPDGQTVVYGARWEGKPSEVFTTRLDLAEGEALSLAPGAYLHADHGGEALVGYEDSRLARVPLVGGTPRDVAQNVVDSDWGLTGDIAVIRSQPPPKTRSWLEYPIGKTLLESSEERPLRELRVSPDGDHVAFTEGLVGASGGDVIVVDRSGHRTVLSTGWMDVSGLAWSPDGQEVWFTAGGPARGGVGSALALKELHAVSLARRERLLLRTAGDVTLHDVFRDGRVLLSHGRSRVESRGKLAGDEIERDLTYLDGTFTVGISDDGRAVLFQEGAQAGGPRNTVHLRRVGDASPIRLGEGAAVALSPDGRRAIAIVGSPAQSGSRLVLLSAGAEPPRELPRGTVDAVSWAFWTPDGRRVIFNGKEKDRAWRAYTLELPDGQPQPISPEGTDCRPASQGWALCCQGHEDKGAGVCDWGLRSLNGGETGPARWIGREEGVIAWSPDGRHAFVAGSSQPPLRVFRVDVATGRREPWLDTSPPDAAGLDPQHYVGAVLSPDGRYYAYGYVRRLSDLFLVEGLR